MNAGNGGGSGGRILVFLSELLNYRGKLIAVGGPGYGHGSPGTVYVQSDIGVDRHSQIWVDNRVRGNLNSCDYPVYLNVTDLTDLHLVDRACARLTQVKAQREVNTLSPLRVLLYIFSLFHVCNFFQ